MNTLYAVLTEYRRRKEVEAILISVFPALTLVVGDGYWKGYKEKSVIILVLTRSERRIRAAVKEIKKLNSQDAVLVLKINVCPMFI